MALGLLPEGARQSSGTMTATEDTLGQVNVFLRMGPGNGKVVCHVLKSVRHNAPQLLGISWLVPNNAILDPVVRSILFGLRGHTWLPDGRSSKTSAPLSISEIVNEADVNLALERLYRSL